MESRRSVRRQGSFLLVLIVVLLVPCNTAKAEAQPHSNANDSSVAAEPSSPEPSQPFRAKFADAVEKLVFLIFGALITLTGIRYQNRIATKKEKKAAVVARLEEIFTLSEDAVRWSGELMRSIANTLLGKSRDDPQEPRSSPVQRISMLARLYEPDVLPSAEVLRERCEKLSSLHSQTMLESMRRTVKDSEVQPMLDRFPKAFGDMVSILSEIANGSKELNLEVERAMRKYI